VRTVAHPSPNHDARHSGARIEILLIHYTGMATAQAALARMSDPESKVSAHYTIDEDGTVYALVPEDRRAWHAGEAAWRGVTDVNGLSVGIELVNPGHELGYRKFPDAQMEALATLAADIVARHRIPPRHVLGHSDVAPLRKTDPGELFDWSRLAAAGVGLWPFTEAAIGMADGPVLDAGARDPAVAAAQDLLSRYGYRTPASAMLDEETMAVLSAFQRHFRPARVDGRLDTETVARPIALVEHVGA